jgi:hypothetical protein
MKPFAGAFVNKKVISPAKKVAGWPISADLL